MAPKKFDIKKAIAAAYGQQGGYIRAARLTKAERVAIATKASKASGGWPKGKKRGPSPLRGRTLARFFVQHVAADTRWPHHVIDRETKTSIDQHAERVTAVAHAHKLNLRAVR